MLNRRYSSTRTFFRYVHLEEVLTIAGHTEAACDLARLAGLEEAGVICEIMNDDGTMARRDDLIKFSKIHDLKLEQ